MKRMEDEEVGGEEVEGEEERRSGVNLGEVTPKGEGESKPKWADGPKGPNGPIL